MTFHQEKHQSIKIAPAIKDKKPAEKDVKVIIIYMFHILQESREKMSMMRKEKEGKNAPKWNIYRWKIQSRKRKIHCLG